MGIFFRLSAGGGLLLLRDEVVLNRADGIMSFSIGVALAVAIATAPSVASLFITGIVFAGAIAMYAMILPGISGSFMLVLMGMYAPVLAAVGISSSLNMVFAAGCVTGLVSFPNCWINYCTYTACLPGVSQWRSHGFSGGDLAVACVR